MSPGAAAQVSPHTTPCWMISYSCSFMRALLYWHVKGTMTKFNIWKKISSNPEIFKCNCSLSEFLCTISKTSTQNTAIHKRIYHPGLWLGNLGLELTQSMKTNDVKVTGCAVSSCVAIVPPNESRKWPKCRASHSKAESHNIHIA